jgi:hypothetical protein
MAPERAITHLAFSGDGGPPYGITPSAVLSWDVDP